MTKKRKMKMMMKTDNSLNEEKVLRRTIEVLNEFCITANLKGKSYLRSAICQIAKDETAIENIMKILYADIAKSFNTTVSRVERCIRFAVCTGWDRCNPEVKKKYFGSFVDLHIIPTNSEFIANIAEYIRYEITGLITA